MAELIGRCRRCAFWDVGHADRDKAEQGDCRTPDPRIGTDGDVPFTKPDFGCAAWAPADPYEAAGLSMSRAFGRVLDEQLGPNELDQLETAFLALLYWAGECGVEMLACTRFGWAGFRLYVASSAAFNHGFGDCARAVLPYNADVAIQYLEARNWGGEVLP